MKYNISILLSANNDLLEICNTLEKFGDKPVGIFTESFYKFIDNISNMPSMFPQYARKPKYRKAGLVYDYLAFYRIDEKNKTVKIYRILHGKQNIESLL